MNQDKEEVEIDFLELGRKLWDNKKFIIKCSVIGAIVGIVIAFSIPKTYTTTVILTTESSKSAGGSMGALASMAGINLGAVGDEDALSPDLYPNIISSTPFAQGLLNINVSDEKQGINTSLYNYLKDEQKTSWWNYIFAFPSLLIKQFESKEKELNINTNTKHSIPKVELEIIKTLTDSYRISTNKKTGLIVLDVSAQSSSISAFLGDTITNFLQTYIIEYRTKKARTDLHNSLKLYDHSRERYYILQDSLASFADANKNIISAKYRINQEKLQNEATIAYTLYTQMAQQVQMNKVKVQDNTPVFTIIQPAVEPIYAESPKKNIIATIFLLLSIVSSACWVLKKEILDIC